MTLKGIQDQILIHDDDEDDDEVKRALFMT